MIQSFITRAIIDGNTDPKALASLAVGKLRKKVGGPWLFGC